MSIADQILLGGCAQAIDSIHGESIKVLSGLDAGKSFRIMQRETEQDVEFSGDFTPDPRAQRVIRFMDGTPIPRLDGADRIQTEDGKIWNAMRRPDGGYLSTDFNLSEVVAGKDT